MTKVEASGVCTAFGRQAAAALAMAHEGVDKLEILARTGSSVALVDVDLEIAEGEVFVLMGLSGSGKSTLVRHLNRLIDPSSGEIRVDGRDILRLDPAALRDFRRSTVSMVFQGFGLLPHRTVLQNVAFGRVARGEARSKAEQAARGWIDRVGLGGYADRRPGELSGGMRQRVGLARALAVETPLLLLDEPFSALDPLIRTEMQDLLIELQSSLRKTLVFVTHDLDEAVRLADKIAVMKDGRIVQVGAPRTILDSPADAYVARFVKRSER